jgi:hypothetical protein
MKTTTKGKTKKAPQRPVPDVKAATREMLARVAGWMSTNLAEPMLYGVLPQGASKEEWAALEEARALATEYVRLGARL